MKIRVQIKMIFQKTEIAMDIDVFTIRENSVTVSEKLYDVL